VAGETWPGEEWLMTDLNADLTSAEYLQGVEQGFWGMPERVGDTVYITLNAPDGRIFLGQFDCSAYWEQPIRCLFVNPETRRVDLSFWPDGNAYFEQWIKFKTTAPNPPFICWDQDRGGMDIGGHKDWQSLKKWQSEKNQLVVYLNFLRRMLHVESNGYLRKKSSTTAST
jgi:hypothetical protein